MPARTAGKGSSASAPRAVSARATSTAAAGSATVNSTSSPIVLITWPPWSTTSVVVSCSKPSTHRTSSGPSRLRLCVV